MSFIVFCRMLDVTEYHFDTISKIIFVYRIQDRIFRCVLFEEFFHGLKYSNPEDSRTGHPQSGCPCSIIIDKSLGGRVHLNTFGFWTLL